MAAQSVLGHMEGSMIHINWEFLKEQIEEPKGILVQFASDSEFTSNLKSFLMPHSSGGTFDIGNGNWFFRVGTLYGSEQSGKVTWTGIYGPAPITHPKLSPPLRMPSLSILHTQSIVDGIRLHTGSSKTNMIILQYSEDSSFKASKTTTLYQSDLGKGYFDCNGLSSSKTYSIRFATFPSPNKHLPNESTVMLERFTSVHGKIPALKPKPADGGMHATFRGDDVILKEVRSKPNFKFPSHAEYLRYQAAVARNQKEKTIEHT
jgi:hypothetical protein